MSENIFAKIINVYPYHDFFENYVYISFAHINLRCHTLLLHVLFKSFVSDRVCVIGLELSIFAF